jgi:hypothetical protein
VVSEVGTYVEVCILISLYAGTPAFLTDVIRGFSQSRPQNSGILYFLSHTCVRLLSLMTLFPFHLKTHTVYIKIISVKGTRNNKCDNDPSTSNDYPTVIRRIMSWKWDSKSMIVPNQSFSENPTFHLWHQLNNSPFQAQPAPPTTTNQPTNQKAN